MDDHWKNLKKADGGVWLYVSLFAVLAVVIVVLVLRKKKQQKLEEMRRSARDKRMKPHSK
jgi:heme exporter protein D